MRIEKLTRFRLAAARPCNTTGISFRKTDGDTEAFSSPALAIRGLNVALYSWLAPRMDITSFAVNMSLNQPDSITVSITLIVTPGREADFERALADPPIA